MKIAWSSAALDDLDRFAAFLLTKHPALAGAVAGSLHQAVGSLSEFPERGRLLDGGKGFRELVTNVLRARYVVRYRIHQETIFILRVFHGREDR